MQTHSKSIAPAKQKQVKEVELELSRPQGKIFAARKQRILNMAGQGGGKSGSIGFMSGLFITLFPKVKGFIGANTYMQLSQSTLPQCTKMWAQYFGLKKYDINTKQGDYVIDKQPPSHFKKYQDFKSYNNIISFKNGHCIFVGSLDNYLAHDGKEFAYAHLDETKDTKEVAIKMVILARLRQPGIWHNTGDDNPLTNLVDIEKQERPLTAEELKNYVPFNPCYIHTSPAEGTVQWLAEMFELEQYENEILQHIVSDTDFFYKEHGNKAICIYSTFHNKKNLPDNYIEGRLNDLTEGQALKFVYGYPFSKTGGEFYTQFERIRHIQPAAFMAGRPLHITLDFNVLPYMTLLVAQLEETDTEFRIKFISEYCLKSPENSTTAVCEAFLRDYQDHITDLFYYGDASGRSRIAGKGDTTNYDDLQEVLKYFLSNASDRVSRANKPILKRRDFIERIMAGKVYLDGKKVVIVFDPSCTELIKDFQYLKLGPEGKLKELTKNEEGVRHQKLGHTSDACEYLICSVLEDLM
jgi:hypothetical protein